MRVFVPDRLGFAGRQWPAALALRVAIDAALFAVFALHHSLFARESIKRRVARVLPDRLLRSFYVWTASLLLLIVLALWQTRIAGTPTPSPAGARSRTPRCRWAASG